MSRSRDTSKAIADIVNNAMSIATLASTKVSGTNVTDIVKLTQAEYDALPGGPDATTVYIIVG